MKDTRNVKGASKLKRRLLTLRARMENIVEDSRVENLLVNRIKRRMVQGVDTNLVPFHPLAPATIRRKKHKKTVRGPGAILFETGAMYDAIGVTKRRGQLSSPTGAGFSIGIASSNAKIQERAREHNFGNGRLPQRQFLGVNRLDVKAVDSLMRREMAKIIARSGLA